jgi:hypothetical protein
MQNDNDAAQQQQVMLDRLTAEALAQLPDKYRAPLVLHYLEGMSQEQTAAALGVTPGVVNMRISRGREQLKKRLAKANVAVGAALVPAFLSSHAEAGIVSKTVFADILPAALAVRTGGVAGANGLVSQQVITLLQGAGKTMIAMKTVFVAASAAVLLAVAVAVVAGTMKDKPAAPADTPKPEPVVQNDPAPVTADPDLKDPVAALEFQKRLWLQGADIVAIGTYHRFISPKSFPHIAVDEVI